jgi:hypothetical protein
MADFTLATYNLTIHDFNGDGRVDDSTGEGIPDDRDGDRYPDPPSATTPSPMTPWKVQPEGLHPVCPQC